jgi:hypothetical protein
VSPLPEGARLLHVGPHKTGTTSLQNALWNARGSLRAQGVRHAGRGRNPSNAARAVVEQPSPYSVEKPPSMRHWSDLLRDVRGAREPRVVISSEFFAWATPDAIQRIVDDLDPERLYVAVTLRALVRVMPSMWQQNVQAGTVARLEEWVDSVLSDPKRPFWTLHRHDQLIERWATVVGPERVSAVVVDDRDHGAVMRAFERLLGLTPGTLVPEADRANRSLTLVEAEAVRGFNLAFSAEHLPRDLHARTMRFGAAQLMKTRVPPPGEQPVGLPAWSLPRIAEIQGQIVDYVRASGVNVIGDLEILTDATAPAATELAADAIPLEVVGSMAMGLLTSTGAIRQASASRGPFKFAEPVEVSRVPTYQLVGSIAGRAWRATVGRVVGWIPIPGRRGRD